MAGSRRLAAHSVAYQLEKQPYRFSFIQAIRLIHWIRRGMGTFHQPIGTDSAPSQEAVRIVGDAALSFPAAEVVDLKIVNPERSTLEDDSEAARGAERTLGLTSDGQPQVTVAFMGIYGASGVLPYFDTQRIIDTGSRENPEKDLLDLFNHRILSYFFRASIKYRVPFAYESEDLQAGAGDTILSKMLLAIGGLGTPGLQRRMAFPDEWAIEFCQFFGHKPKNVISLAAMIESRFGVPVDIWQFQGQWLTLSEESKSYMPARQMPLGQNCRLGHSFIVGDRIWDVQSRFRVRLGPLDREAFEAMLPGSVQLTKVAQLIRLYAGIHLDFDIQLELRATDVPQTVLDGRSSRLGMNAWLISTPPSTNKDDAVFALSGQPSR